MEKKHLGAGGSSCTTKHWELFQEALTHAHHCFARYYYSWALYYDYSWALCYYYSWALLVWTLHEVAGWDEDRVSSGDGFHVTVRLHYPLARPHAVPGVRGSNESRQRRGESLHPWAEVTRALS